MIFSNFRNTSYDLGKPIGLGFCTNVTLCARTGVTTKCAALSQSKSSVVIIIVTHYMTSGPFIRGKIGTG